MKYILKHFDTPLIVFSADDGAEANIKIISVNEEQKRFLPLDLAEISPYGMESWIRKRMISWHRAYADTFLSSMGLSLNRPMGIMLISKGLSLNDSYWVVEEGFEGTFEKYNLYDNRFNRILGAIAFTGYGSVNSFLNSSPEFTTNGALPKCWRRKGNKISLFKGGTQGASNTGYEPYSEYYASKIGKIIGINVIEYNLARWKNTLCSTCELFTGKDISFVPVGRIVTSGGMKAVRAYYESLGEEYVNALNDMIVFDALILNTDRHFGNFGFLVDSHTNEIIAPAPLFDHGNSLLNFAGTDAWEDEESILKYAETRLPCVYDDFMEEAKAVLTHQHRVQLKKLLDCKIPLHSRYNLERKRMTLLTYVVRHQAEKLLEISKNI